MAIFALILRPIDSIFLFMYRCTPLLFLFLVMCYPSQNLAASSLGDSLRWVNTHADWYSFEKPSDGYANDFLKQSIAPVAVGVAGLSIMAVDGWKQQWQASLNWDADDHVKLYDDELRHAPYLVAAALPLFGYYPKDKVLHAIPLAITAYCFADLCVHSLKTVTHVQRPRPEWSHLYNSFPSQHTSMAFVAATVLHREYGHHSPWISIGGYAVASYVGYARVARNCHWVPDVLVGAAIGVLSTNLVYLAYDGLSDWLTQESRLSCLPYCSNGTVGCYLSYQF